MIKKDFDVFANRYRLILEKGVKNYPEYYSKSTMLEYDRFIYESKKSLKKSNLLEGWRMPSISYIHPLQLVEKSLLSESHYIAINKLDEGIISKVGGYLQRAAGRVFGAGSSQTLKDQGASGGGGGDGQVLGAGGEVDTDQTLAALRDKHKSFRDQLTAVIALKNWSQKKTGDEPFWTGNAKMTKDAFDKELAAIETEIREALPKIETATTLSEALSSRNRLARLSEVAITQGLFERSVFAPPPGVIDNDSPIVSSAQETNIIARLHAMYDTSTGLDSQGRRTAIFADEPNVTKIANDVGVSPLAVRGVAHHMSLPSGDSLSVHGRLPAAVIVKDGEVIVKTLPVTAPDPTPGPHPAPTPGPDQPPAPPGRPGPEHPPAPHTDPHAPPHAPPHTDPKPHGHDGGGHSKLLWGALAAIVTAGIYGGVTMRKRRQRLEKLIAVKGADEADVTPPVVLPAETPGEVAPLPKIAEIETARVKEEAEEAAKPKGTPVPAPDEDAPELIYGPTDSEVSPAVPPEVGENGLKKIYVYKGKGGQGFQSRVAQKINKIPGMNPRDVGKYQSISSKVMNALAKDLKNTGKFTVLESRKKAGGDNASKDDNASLVATLAELDKVTQPQVREILRFEIYQLLRGARLRVRSDILKRGSSPEVSLESEADATDTSSAEVKGSAEKGKEGTKTPAEKSPDEILKAKLKSRLSSFNANEKQFFSKAEWEELISANDKNFGGDNEEARLGRDVIRNHAEDARSSAGITLNPAKKGNAKKELVVLKNYGNVMESLRRKYRLGLITLREYSIRKQKIEMIVLKEQIKRQILSTRK